MSTCQAKTNAKTGDTAQKAEAGGPPLAIGVSPTAAGPLNSFYSDGPILRLDTTCIVQRTPSDDELQLFTIALQGLSGSRHRDVIIATIREVYTPILAEANRRLEITDGSDGDLYLRFFPETVQSGPCRGTLLGNEAGQVWVGSHLAMRVCCDPSTESCRYPYLPLFIGEEPELGRFLSNTAVHELAHQLGVGHLAAPDNYMYDGPCTIPPADRTIYNMREYYSQELSFSPMQTLRMVMNIILNRYPGGVQMNPPPQGEP